MELRFSSLKILRNLFKRLVICWTFLRMFCKEFQSGIRRAYLNVDCPIAMMDFLSKWCQSKVNFTSFHCFLKCMVHVQDSVCCKLEQSLWYFPSRWFHDLDEVCTNIVDWNGWVFKKMQSRGNFETIARGDIYRRLPCEELRIGDLRFSQPTWVGFFTPICLTMGTFRP